MLILRRATVVICFIMLVITGCRQMTKPGTEQSVDPVIQIDTVATVAAVVDPDNMAPEMARDSAMFFTQDGFSRDDQREAAEAFEMAGLFNIRYSWEEAAKSFDLAGWNWELCYAPRKAYSAYMASAECYWKLYDVQSAVNQIGKANVALTRFADD